MGVGVAVDVAVDVGVLVGPSVGVAVDVGVLVGPSVGVAVDVGVDVGVGVGVDGGLAPFSSTLTLLLKYDALSTARSGILSLFRSSITIKVGIPPTA